MDDFWKRLAVEIVSHGYNYEKNNVEWGVPSRGARLKEIVVRAVGRLGFFRRPSALAQIQAIPACIGDAAGLFADDESRDLLVRLMAYRVLGPRHYRLPMNTPEYWKKREGTRPVVKHKDGTGEFLYQDVRYVGELRHFFNTFILQQYRCVRANIGVRPGDIVIDGGACRGDTTLYFLHCGAS